MRTRLATGGEVSKNHGEINAVRLLSSSGTMQMDRDAAGELDPSDDLDFDHFSQQKQTLCVFCTEN